MKSIEPESICKKCRGHGSILAEGNQRLTSIRVDCPECEGDGFIEVIKSNESRVHSSSLDSMYGRLATREEIFGKKRGRKPKVSVKINE